MSKRFALRAYVTLMPLLPGLSHDARYKLTYLLSERISKIGQDLSKL